MSEDARPSSPSGSERRSVLTNTSNLMMAGGLVAGYGAFAAIAARFLYPAEDGDGVWMFVSDLKGFPVGSSLSYSAPSGATITIARTGSSGGADDFNALSSVCPHLGCQVHWEPQNQRFFCPCHNGVFDSSGRGVAGPPAEAGQSLAEYPLKVERGLLYIRVRAVEVADASEWSEELPPGPPGPGHDPCLFRSPDPDLRA